MNDAQFFKGLLPELADLARTHRQRCKDAGIDLDWVSGFRTPEEQRTAFAQGRKQTPAGWVTVNARQIVTMALPDKAPHCRGAAYDVAPLDEKGKLDWKRLDLFAKVAKLTPAGLTWGGTFKIHDLDHFELTGWRKIPFTEVV